MCLFFNCKKSKLFLFGGFYLEGESQVRVSCDPYLGLGLESEGSLKTVVPSHVFVSSYCLLFTLIGSQVHNKLLS